MSLTLVYDGGCPFCRHFALRSELTSGIPDLKIRDGRSEQALALRQKLRRRGMNLANGAVLLEGDQAWRQCSHCRALSPHAAWRPFVTTVTKAFPGRCMLHAVLSRIAVGQAFFTGVAACWRPRSQARLNSSGVGGPPGPTVAAGTTDLLKHRLRSCFS